MIEAQIALSQAASMRTATILLHQYQGALERELSAICDLLDSGNQKSAEVQLKSLLETTELGLHLTRPWQVVIAGKPNVGKSSLINALVGYQRAIVFDQPGTTRDVVTASTVIDGWPVVLSDTAGLHDSTDELESAGIALARKRLATADLVVWVSDASSPGTSRQAVIEGEANEFHLSLFKKRLLVLNKIDRMSEIFDVPSDVIATSATSGVGIEKLLVEISEALAPAVPSSGEGVLFTVRQQEFVQLALEACHKGDSGLAADLLGRVAAR
jgi:tRNA modification GTPase